MDDDPPGAPDEERHRSQRRAHQIDQRDAQEQPDENEIRERSVDLIRLANECYGRPDAGDVEDGGAFAPRFGFVPPQKDERRREPAR